VLSQNSIVSAMRIAQRIVRQGVIPFYIMRKTSHWHQTIIMIDLSAVKIYYIDCTLDEGAWRWEKIQNRHLQQLQPLSPDLYLYVESIGLRQLYIRYTTNMSYAHILV